ncbi:TadE/TadG family type IV pilus assembly protein [Bradyrhizobium erythrophlei]|uniref:TadE/TadG family type IV pilus assembly protein n=1 Tax=Bradyrhizobium erythrophlei TaxID=1437360 RepID=UPI0035F0DFE5
MPPPARFAGNILCRFRRNRRGSAAVEFALVAPLFFGLLFAIIEVAFIFFAGQMLETATQDSARMVLTGQAQNGQIPGCSTPCTQAQFKTDVVCSKISMLFDCANGIYVDVRSYSQFSSVSVTPPIDAGGNFMPAMQYSPGNAGDIVVVRVFYQWPVFVSGLGFNAANLSNGKRLLTATAAFKNEPF